MNHLTRAPLLLSALFLGTACASSQEPQKEEAPQGPTIEAMTMEGPVAGYTDGTIHTFKGIPYAAPVEGLDRWLPPRPPKKRTEIFNAREVGPACEQSVAAIPRWMLTEAGETVLYDMTHIEKFASQKKGPDCLRLNIWTPKLGSADGSTSPAAPEAVPAEEPVDAPQVNDDTVAANTDGTSNLDDSAAPVPNDEGVATPDETTPPRADSDAKEGAEEQVVSPSDEAIETPVPQEKPKGLPVIVHLHGGGLTSGSAIHPAQDGSLLAQQGVVVVTINYRLGAIGFLAGDGLFEGEVLEGNRGIKDTLRALEWVRDNIHNFGGDPDNVTLMGQSGGGTNVWTLLASPHAKGLVRRAVIMSGPTYTYPLADHLALTKDVLKEWDVKPGDTEALANVATEDAIATTTTTLAAGSDDEYGLMSRVILPSAGAHNTPFLPDPVLAAIEKGRLNGIDLLVGTCNDDAKVSILMVPLPNSMAIDIWNGFMKGLVADDDEGFEAMTQKYIEAMPEVSETRAKEQLQTDALYRMPTLRAAEAHATTTRETEAKTFVYQFNWKSPAFPEDVGAMHGLDLIFSWGQLEKFPKPLGFENKKIPATTQKLSQGMLEAFANFAKTGVPTSEHLPAWPEYSAEERKTMIFDVDTKVVSDPAPHLRKLWE